MYSQALNDFIDDCFIAKDSICDFNTRESLKLDPLTNSLIIEMKLKSNNKSIDRFK